MSEASEKLRMRALVARKESRLDDARQDLIEAIDLCRQANNDGAIDLARALTALAQIERDLHKNEAALKNYEKAISIYRNKDDAQMLAHTIRHVADIHRNLGHTEAAESSYREALALYRADKNTPALDLANALRGYALLKGDLRDAEHAKALWEEARELYAAVNVEAGVAESARRLAALKAQS